MGLTACHANVKERVGVAYCDSVAPQEFKPGTRIHSHRMFFLCGEYNAISLKLEVSMRAVGEWKREVS